MIQGANPRGQTVPLAVEGATDWTATATPNPTWLSFPARGARGGRGRGGTTQVNRFFTATVNAGSLSPGDYQTLTANAETLSPGTYQTTITIDAPGAANPKQTIAVNLRVLPATFSWTKESGPGTVTFADPKALATTATFSAPGSYVLKLTVKTGETTASSTFNVAAETPPPEKQLDAVYTKNFKIDSPLWNARAKALIVSWIPHCIDQINRTDLTQGPGGIDNFIEAAKALRGEPHGAHKGYVFSNAWVHQTVESMCIALMVDPQGDPEIIKAHAKMRATLDDWIPKILAAQEPDGYLQTAFTLRDPQRWPDRWTPQGRGNHEGYTAGYFIESAINHYLMTGKKDARLYNAAKKLADCWCDNIGPPPKKEWFDGHQEMEQALVRFGRFVNDMEGGGKGDRYIQLAKFLLDSRKDGTEYDQSHLPVIQQYEAVGPRRARRVHLLGHGRCRGRNARPRLPERRHVALGQHRQQEVLRHRRRRQRRDVGRLRPELFAAQQRLLRVVLELRRDLLPVEDEPDVSRRPVRRPVRADHVQRSAGRHGSGWEEFLLHQSAGLERPAHAVAQLPVLRRQHPADAADDAHLDLRQEPGRHLRQPLRRQHHHRRRRRRHRRRDGPGDQLSLGRQGFDHGESRDPEKFQHQGPGAEPRCQRALQEHAGGQRHYSLWPSTAVRSSR